MHPETFRFWHRFTGSMASTLGFFANTLLIYIIYKSAHPVKQIFCLMIFVDMTFLIVTAATEPLIIVVEGNEFLIQNGMFRHLPHPFNGFMTTFYVFGLYFSICSICVQFIFRYLILCKEITVSNFVLALFLLVPMIAASGVAYLYHIGFSFNEMDTQFATDTLKDILLETNETTVYLSGLSRSGNPLLIALASVGFSCITINYIVIAFCVFKIQKRLKILLPLLPHNHRQMQKQISLTLFVLAGCPLFISIGPLGCVCYCAMTRGTAFWSMIVLTMGFSWVPFTNAILTMIIVKEFRPTQIFLKIRNRPNAVGSDPTPNYIM